MLKPMNNHINEIKIKSFFLELSAVFAAIFPLCLLPTENDAAVVI